jgi:hypothetical protein
MGASARYPPSPVAGLRQSRPAVRQREIAPPPFLAQQDVAKGGVLVFVMGAKPVW